MKCNLEPGMNYFHINYLGWRLYYLAQIRGMVGETKWKKYTLMFIISPRGCFFAIPANIRKII